MSLHRYMYVNNSPITYWDMYGYNFFDDLKSNAEWLVTDGADNLKEGFKGVASAGGDIVFGVGTIASYSNQISYSVFTKPLDWIGIDAPQQFVDNWGDAQRQGMHLLQYEYDNRLGVTDWKYTPKYQDRGLLCNAVTGICHLPDALTTTCSSEQGYIFTHTLLDATAIYGLAKAGFGAAKGLIGVTDDAGRVASRAGGVANVVDDAGNYSRIGSTGDIGEEALKSLGGTSQYRMTTTQGTRVIDQMVVDEAGRLLANESKVGYTSLTKEVQLQVVKDAELLNTGTVNEVTWHFYKSPVTGKVGPSQPLVDFLKQNNINYIIHE